MCMFFYEDFQLGSYEEIGDTLFLHLVHFSRFCPKKALPSTAMVRLCLVERFLGKNVKSPPSEEIKCHLSFQHFLPSTKVLAMEVQIGALLFCQVKMFYLAMQCSWRQNSPGTTFHPTPPTLLLKVSAQKHCHLLDTLNFGYKKKRKKFLCKGTHNLRK